MIPTNDCEGVSVQYGGTPLTLLGVAQTEDKSRTELWSMIGPPTGQHDVEITMTTSTEILVVSASYTGIAQTNTVYNIRSGSGKMVDSLGIKSFSKVGGIAIGNGVVDNPNSHVTTLYGTQVRDWDYTGNNLRNEAISAQLPFDNDNIAVPNTLTEKANYAIIVVGLEGA